MMESSPAGPSKQIDRTSRSFLAITVEVAPTGLAPFLDRLRPGSGFAVAASGELRLQNGTLYSAFTADRPDNLTNTENDDDDQRPPKRVFVEEVTHRGSPVSVLGLGLGVVVVGVLRCR